MPPRPDEKRREQLLDELEAIMLAEGFAHLRIGSLAERLHCSRSTLYKLAPSKDELFESVYARWADRIVAEAIAFAEQGSTPAEKIVRMGKVAGRLQAKGSPEFWRDVRDNPTTAAVMGRTRAIGYRRVQAFLDEGIAAGTVRPMNTAFIGYLVWAGAVASRDPDLMIEYGITTDEAVELIGELVARGTAV